MCSILFCDLVGFTPLSESRDPEEVRELLSRYFETARTVIARYGGVVEKFIGDAVMAVWGTPIAVDGDTERAVRAALDLVAAIAELGVEIDTPSLAARAGVVTGEVAVTLGAVNEGMVAGDAVNTAARVQSVAVPGAVLVDASTRRLAEAGVEFADAGEFELKGKAEPQQLWRAGRVLSNVGGAQRVDGLEAPLTGRDPELRLIKELFHASVDRRQLRLVAVTGPAGVGKSRLGWEFEKYIDGLADAVWWHRGRCLSYGDGVSFWALAEVVRQRLDIAEDDPADVAAGKLVEGMKPHVTDASEREYIGVRLARLLGVEFGADAGHDLAREELFAGWRLWFERLADSSPVVLLIEDLHNADVGLLDFIDHLIDWGRDAPIFVITFGRPEMRVERGTWSSGRNRTQLGIDPLDAASMAVLLDTLVPGLPADAATAIATRASGIPLFAVETIRSLIDRDIVMPSNGVYKLVGDVGTLSVPDSLHATLAARLDALAPQLRNLVADAAVLGSSFPAEAVCAISGRSIDEVRDLIIELTRRGVLEVVADPLSPQRGTYRFSNDMLREVARGTLSRHDRKARHLAVAAHLRATFANDGEEVIDVIAQHYRDALTAVPDAADAAEIRVHAAEALARAGERDQRVGAQASAGASFADAAELLVETDAPNATTRAADLWLRATEALHRAADWETGSKVAIRAQQAFVEVGDVRGAARAQARTGKALRFAGRHADAREHIGNALAVLRDDPDADTVDALNQIAALEVLAGGGDAERLSAEAITIAQLVDTPVELLVSVFNNRGLILSHRGREQEGVMYLREAVRLAEQAGDLFAQGYLLANIASALGATDPVAAAGAAREAAAISRRAGGRFSLGDAVQVLAAALLDMGNWDDAAAVVSEAIEQDGLGDVDVIAHVAAEIAALRGDVGSARAHYARVPHLSTSEDPQDRSMAAHVAALVGVAEMRDDVALAKAAESFAVVAAAGYGLEIARGSWPIAARAAHALDDNQKVDELVAQLDDAFKTRPMPSSLRADRALALARRAAVRGEASAGEQFDAAVADLRKRSTPYSLAHGLLDYAQHLIGSGRSEQAAPLVEEARDIGEHLRALPLVSRAEATLITANQPTRI